jgi:DNA repair exonuclease SbcCD ATPase subunit
VRFTEIAIQNFLSFGEQQTIALADQGLVAIFGQNNDSASADSNGAGKSTIMEAIVWALWGETIRGYKSDEVVNKHVGKDCVVSLTLEDAGQVYVVTRTRCMSKTKRPNDVQLTIGGSAATAGINVDTQDAINTIIGMDQKTFVQSVLLCHGTKPFSELTDAAQKEVLEDILQISQFAHARDVVNARLKDRQNQLAVVNSEMQQLLGSQTSLEERKQKLTQLSNEHAVSIATRKTDLLRRKAQAETQIDTEYYSQGLDKLLDTMKDMDERVIEHRKQEDVYSAKIMLAMKMSNKKKSEAEQKRAVLHAMHNTYTDDCSTINELVGKPCPTCKRAVDPDEAENMLADWDSALNKVTVEAANLDNEISQIEQLEHKTIATLEANKKLVRQEVSTLQAQQQLLHAKIQQRSAALQLICQLEQQVFNLSEEIDQLETEKDPYGQMVIDVTAELRAVTSKAQRTYYRKTALDMEVNHLLFWDRGFGNQGIKSFVIEGVIPFLNERAQYYADILSGGDLQIAFRAQKQLKSGQMRDEFQVHVHNQQGAEVYKGNSAGERRRIDTAVGWALGDLAATRAKKPIRFKGLDEIFESLDETGCDSVMKLLHAVLPQYETILCITHDDSFRNQFSSVISVVKENGCSRIVR